MALRTAPLSEQTRRTCASKVRQFLAWLAGTDLDEDPLADADGPHILARQARRQPSGLLWCRAHYLDQK